MKTEVPARNTYQIFKNWLIINRGLSEERAEVSVSNIRKIDSGLAKIKYIDGHETECLYRIYQDILKFRDHKRSEQLKEVKPVKENIGRVYSAITDDRKLGAMLGNVSKTKKKDFKNAFISYCDFLGSITGTFTLEDLDDIYIKRERIRSSKNKPSEQLSTEFFTKGIVAALRKIGVFNTDIFSKGDKSAIGVPLDQLNEFVDVILTMHGVAAHNNVIEALSFIRMSDGSLKSGLCDLLVTRENICVDGKRLLSDEVMSIQCNSEAATLIVTMASDNHSQVVNIPVLSSRRKYNRILSFRIVFMINMSEQVEYLNHLRECCYAIRQSLREYNNLMCPIREKKRLSRYEVDIPIGNMKRKLTATEKELLILQAIQQVNTGMLEFAVRDLIETLKLYSKTYRIELVIE